MMSLATPFACFEDTTPEAPPVENPVVTITTTGATFAPKIWLHTGVSATVTWTFSDETTSDSLAPSVDFETEATRVHTLEVVPASALACINFGYNDQEDGGIFHTPSSYNLTPTEVSACTGLQDGAPNITRFLASHSAIQAIDLSDLADLEIVEFYNARPLATIDLTGCTALRRVCFEGDNLDALDISDALAIEDVRCRGQGITQGQTGDFTISLGPVTALWHLCLGTQMDGRVYGLDDIFNGTTVLPAIVEIWPWDSNIGGALALNAPNNTLRSVWASGCGFTSFDGTNTTWSATGVRELFVSSSPMTSIDLTNCGSVHSLQMASCQLTQAQIDDVLAFFVANGTDPGDIDLSGTNAYPSEQGLADVATLVGMGYTVTLVEPPS